MKENAYFENIDRLLSVEMRARGLPQGIVPQLYEIARGSGEPLSLRIARELSALRGGRVGILTGVYFPPHLPKGEIDGPIGAVVLGRALATLSNSVEIVADPPVVDVIEGLIAAGGATGLAVRAASNVAPESLADGWDACICIEKIGVAADGVLHTITGTPFTAHEDAVSSDQVVELMNEQGKVTVGLGDGGNEIGFGKIREDALEIVPHGETIMTTTATTHLFPVNISNCGAYGLTTALGLLLSRADLIPDADEIERLVRLANSLGCIDGGTGDKGFIGDDGVPIDSIKALVTIMGSIFRQSQVDSHRHF